MVSKGYNVAKCMFVDVLLDFGLVELTDEEIENELGEVKTKEPSKPGIKLFRPGTQKQL